MIWIGLTGSMGSGKSTVAKLLRGLGYPVLDADEVVHGLLAHGSETESEILSTFGESVQESGGRLDRRALGRVVFSDKRKLDLLEGILHPRVRKEVARLRSKLESCGQAVAFYDIPLLFEKNMNADFDFIVVVSASEETRRKRIAARMGLSETEITERFRQQMDPREKEKGASVVILNEGSEAELIAQLHIALKKLKVPLPTVADS